MKVIDCVLLGGELDLLEVRLHELAEVADVHVVVEATETFSGAARGVTLDPDEPRWAPLRHKLVHVVVDDLPPAGDPWAREWFQRNAILRGLAGGRWSADGALCDPLDLVLIGDVDEIPRAAAVVRARDGFVRGVVAFEMGLYYYHVNQRAQYPGGTHDEGRWFPWIGTRGVRFCELTTPQAVRSTDRSNCALVLEDAGWHFSYCGGIDAIRRKIAAYAHQENNRPDIVDPGHLERAVADGRDLFGRDHEFRFVTVPIDDDYPAHLLRNPERFRHLVKHPAAEGPREAGSAPPRGTALRYLFGTEAAFAEVDLVADPPQLSQHWSLSPVMDQLIDEVRPRRIVEVGTWQGSSALHMARAAGPDLEELVCIDTWLGSPETVVDTETSVGVVRSRYFDQLRYTGGYPRIFFTFLSNVVAAGLSHVVTPVPLPSIPAVHVLRRLGVTANLVYIDGAHDYPSVLQDLQHFWTVLEPGGVLFGDDYFGEVARAADEFARQLGLPIVGTDNKYILRKPW